jgi:DMSO/TMAO reductase YedYZ heme-binding membrane subunit
VATDRIIMTPGHRVMAQAVHRAVSFGALAFLIIHIVTEILAQRVHIIDGFVPFLSPFRTFYIGLGTIASDLIVLVIVTSIIRKRFTAHGKAWRWRAIHYSAYLSFVFGVLHGLLGGRSGKPYVDWSYGAAIAFTAFGIAVRFLAISLRPKETLSAPPTAGRGGAGSSPLHAASLTMAQAQLGGTIQSLPLGAGMQAGGMGLPAAGMGLPAAATMQLPAGSYSYGAYGEPSYGAYGEAPLGAHPYGDGMAAYPPRAPASLPAALPAPTRQPLYEPGYVGPPRYEGAPRGTGPIPRADSGAMPRLDPGPMPRGGSGPMPQMGSGPMPQMGTGPMRRNTTGPMPQMGTGQMPRTPTGPMPRTPTGPMPRAGTGPMPQLPPGPPSADPGPMPRGATRPIPRGGTGPGPRAGTGPTPRPGGTGPAPQSGPPPEDRRRPRRPAADEPRGRDRPQRGGGAWR